MKYLYSLCIMLCCTVAGAYAQPKLEIVGGETHDWGNLSPKQPKMETKIELKNSGTEKLVISGVHPTCGCTSAMPAKDTLLPGEKTTMDVSVNLAGKSGSLMKSVNISSNDPVSPNKVLYLKANLINLIEVTPARFVFNDMASGKPATAKISVKNVSQEPVTFSDFTTADGVKLNIRKPFTLKAGEEHEIEATAVGKTVGDYKTEISMKTSHADYPTMTIDGFGQVK